MGGYAVIGLSTVLAMREQSGGGDDGAGPPYPMRLVHGSAASTGHCPVLKVGSVGATATANDQVWHNSSCRHEGIRERLRQMESAESLGDEDRSSEQDKLRDRIRNLEESLQRLGKDNLERAKQGMEKLTEKYFPKGQPGPLHLHYQPGNIPPVSSTHR